MYRTVFHHQNAEQTHNIKVANKFFENVAKLKKILWNESNIEVTYSKLRAD
jgi:hypothetical protein